MIKLLAIAGVLLSFSAQAAEPITPHKRDSIVFCDISDEPVRKIRKFQPLADYVAARLGKYKISYGDVVIARDIPQLVLLLKKGRVDIYMDSTYPAMVVQSKTNAIPVLRRWKNGVSEYRSVIFTRRDSHIGNLSDMTGKTIAFEKIFSTSGFMLPLAHLRKKGYGLSKVNHFSGMLSETDINWVLSGDDQNTIQWVLAKRVDCGAVGSSDFEALPDEALENLKVIGRTPVIPRQIVLVSGDMSKPLVEAVKKILIGMEHDDKGKKILSKFKKTTRFDDLNIDGSEVFSETKEYYRLVEGYLDSTR